MRLFSSILIIIIMAIHLVPCSDAYALAKKNTDTEFVKKGADQQHEKSDECSPFCSCSCCAIPSIAQSRLTITLHPPFFPPHYPEYPRGNFIDISLPIWQPPQLIS